MLMFVGGNRFNLLTVHTVLIAFLVSSPDAKSGFVTAAVKPPIKHVVDRNFSEDGDCAGLEECVLNTDYRDGGSSSAFRKWNVECDAGEAMHAVEDYNDNFVNIDEINCKTNFPNKKPTLSPADIAPPYPFYPHCHVRNLTKDQFTCFDQNIPFGSVHTFTTAMWSKASYGKRSHENTKRNEFMPTLMKCCHTPPGYYLDYKQCRYKFSHDEFGRHLDGQQALRCDDGAVMTGLGIAHGAHDDAKHYVWIQCCPHYFSSLDTPNNDNVDNALSSPKVRRLPKPRFAPTHDVQLQKRRRTGGRRQYARSISLNDQYVVEKIMDELSSGVKPLTSAAPTSSAANITSNARRRRAQLGPTNSEFQIPQFESIAPPPRFPDLPKLPSGLGNFNGLAPPHFGQQGGITLPPLPRGISPFFLPMSQPPFGGLGQFNNTSISAQSPPTSFFPPIAAAPPPPSPATSQSIEIEISQTSTSSPATTTTTSPASSTSPDIVPSDLQQQFLSSVSQNAQFHPYHQPRPFNAAIDYPRYSQAVLKSSYFPFQAQQQQQQSVGESSPSYTKAVIGETGDIGPPMQQQQLQPSNNQQLLPWESNTRQQLPPLYPLSPPPVQQQPQYSHIPSLFNQVVRPPLTDSSPPAAAVAAVGEKLQEEARTLFPSSIADALLREFQPVSTTTSTTSTAPPSTTVSSQPNQTLSIDEQLLKAKQDLNNVAKTIESLSSKTEDFALPQLPQMQSRLLNPNQDGLQRQFAYPNLYNNAQFAAPPTYQQPLYPPQQSFANYYNPPSAAIQPYQARNINGLQQSQLSPVALASAYGDDTAASRESILLDDSIPMAYANRYVKPEVLQRYLLKQRQHAPANGRRPMASQQEQGNFGLFSKQYDTRAQQGRPLYRMRGRPSMLLESVNDQNERYLIPPGGVPRRAVSSTQTPISATDDAQSDEQDNGTPADFLPNSPSNPALQHMPVDGGVRSSPPASRRFIPTTATRRREQSLASAYGYSLPPVEVAAKFAAELSPPQPDDYNPSSATSAEAPIQFGDDASTVGFTNGNSDAAAEITNPDEPIYTGNYSPYNPERGHKRPKPFSALALRKRIASLHRNRPVSPPPTAATPSFGYGRFSSSVGNTLSNYGSSNAEVYDDGADQQQYVQQQQYRDEYSRPPLPAVQQQSAQQLLSPRTYASDEEAHTDYSRAPNYNIQRPQYDYNTQAGPVLDASSPYASQYGLDRNAPALSRRFSSARPTFGIQDAAYTQPPLVPPETVPPTSTTTPITTTVASTTSSTTSTTKSPDLHDAFNKRLDELIASYLSNDERSSTSTAAPLSSSTTEENEEEADSTTKKRLDKRARQELATNVSKLTKRFDFGGLLLEQYLARRMKAEKQKLKAVVSSTTTPATTTTTTTVAPSTTSAVSTASIFDEYVDETPQPEQQSADNGDDKIKYSESPGHKASLEKLKIYFSSLAEKKNPKPLSRVTPRNSTSSAQEIAKAFHDDNVNDRYDLNRKTAPVAGGNLFHSTTVAAVTPSAPKSVSLAFSGFYDTTGRALYYLPNDTSDSFDGQTFETFKKGYVLKPVRTTRDDGKPHYTAEPVIINHDDDKLSRERQFNNYGRQLSLPPRAQERALIPEIESLDDPNRTTMRPVPIPTIDRPQLPLSPVGSGPNQDQDLHEVKLIPPPIGSERFASKLPENKPQQQPPTILPLQWPFLFSPTTFNQNQQPPNQFVLLKANRSPPNQDPANGQRPPGELASRNPANILQERSFLPLMPPMSVPSAHTPYKVPVNFNSDDMLATQDLAAPSAEPAPLPTAAPTTQATPILPYYYPTSTTVRSRTDDYCKHLVSTDFLNVCSQFVRLYQSFTQNIFNTLPQTNSIKPLTTSKQQNSTQNQSSTTTLSSAKTTESTTAPISLELLLNGRKSEFFVKNNNTTATSKAVGAKHHKIIPLNPVKTQ